MSTSIELSVLFFFVDMCGQNQALALSKQYAIQSLASVAYMVNSMATNVLEMFNHQYLQLNGLESTIHNIKQVCGVL